VQESHSVGGSFGGYKQAVLGEEHNRWFFVVTLLIVGYEA